MSVSIVIKKIIHSIEKFLLGCSGASWGEVAKKVSKLGFWEFEAHKDVAP